MAKPLLNYCLVTQNLASIIEDSEYDIDRYPDVSDISGEVIFTPNIANGKAYQLYDSDGEAYTVPVSRIRAKIVNGVITHEHNTGVYLFAAGVGSNPDKITYSVEYRNLRSGELSFSLSPLKFEAIPGGEVDLTMATPVVGATPAGTTKGDKGDKGDPFLYGDFTPEQIDDLKGPLTLADLTPERLETIKGPKGDRGSSIHSVSVDGSDLVFTVDEDGIVEISRVPLVDAANGLRNEIAEELAASKNAATEAEGHADRSASLAYDSSVYRDASLSAAERAEFAANETAQLIEGDFATKNYVDDAVDGKLPNQGRIWTGRSGISSADDAPVGWTGVWEGQDATDLGLPYAGQGVLVTLPNGNHLVQVFYVYPQGSVNSADRTIRIFTRYEDSSGWSEWEEDSARLKAAMWGPQEVVDMSRTSPGRVAVATLDELPNGQFALLNPTVADLIDAPLRGQGLVTSWSLGTHTYQRAEISEGSDGSRVVRVFTRYRDSVGWGEWEEPERTAQVVSYVSPPPAGFRVAPLALTLGNGGGRAPATGSFRIPLTYTPAISRWRLRVSSRQPRSGETSGGEYRVNKIAIGPRGGGGSYTDVPTIVAENIVVPANGEAAATPWMNTDIGSGQDFILGFEYETLSGDAPWTLTGGSWDVGSSAADAQSPNSSTVKLWTPLDWWIEAEVPSTTPVIAALGDSLTCGVGAGLPIYDSWLSKYCRANGALPMHLSASGDSAHMSIPTPQAYKFTRWHHLHRPDALIWAMGSNDFMNGHSAISTQALVEEAVANILPNETINLYATTIMPRAVGQYTSSQDAERVAFNEWIKEERNLFRDVFDFATVADDGTGHLKSEYDSDGIHLLSGGYEALANAITRPVAPPKT